MSSVCAIVAKRPIHSAVGSTTNATASPASANLNSFTLLNRLQAGTALSKERPGMGPTSKWTRGDPTPAVGEERHAGQPRPQQHHRARLRNDVRRRLGNANIPTTGNRSYRDVHRRHAIANAGRVVNPPAARKPSLRVPSKTPVPPLLPQQHTPLAVDPNTSPAPAVEFSTPLGENWGSISCNGGSPKSSTMRLPGRSG